MYEQLLYPSLLTGAMIALLVVGRFAFGLVASIGGSKYSLTYETVKNDNPAVGIRLAAFLLAMVISFLGMMHPSGVGFAQDLNNIGMYGLLAIVALIVSAIVNDKLILYSFDNNMEVVGEKNVAVAIVEASTYFATALIMRGALSGWEGGFAVAVGWFVLGQAFLVLLGFLYRLVVKDVFEGLDTHNVASALSFGGFLLAGGLALGAAVSGPVSSLQADLTSAGLYLAVWLTLIVITRFLADLLLVPTAKISHEIMVDRNVGIGALDACVMLATTLIFTTVW